MVDVKRGAMNSVGTFGSTAKKLAQGPLGIIALFIVLVYGFATLDLSLGQGHLTFGQQWALVLFLVAFPVIVLGVFTFLVMKFHRHLYHPKDFPIPSCR